MKIINPYRFAGASSSLLTDLVAWWSMDETSGTRADSHGSHDLSDNNTVLYTTGKQSNAAYFAGGGAIEYLEAAHHADFIIADTPFTVAGWASMESASDNPARIIAKGDAASSGGSWMVLRNPTGSEDVIARARLADNSGFVSTPTVSITYSAFFFFIFTHDPDANVITLEVNRGTPVTVAITGGVYPGTDVLRFGMWTSNHELNGALDEVGMWRRLLTDDEKNTLYNSGNGMAYPG